MIDEEGEVVWESKLDIYGVELLSGKSKESCPFRFAGQYEDEESGLYYNRFRYYMPEEGVYSQRDPIGLAGGNPTVYGYVWNTLSELDPFGLDCKCPGGYQTHDVDIHRNLSPQINRASGH